MTRFRYVMVTTVATLGIAFAGFVPTAPRLVWNASASVPIGFYTVAPDDRIAVPDLVAVIPPEPIASFMVKRGLSRPGGIPVACQQRCPFVCVNTR